MTVTDFIRKLVEIAKTHERRVFAVDFAPSPEGISLILRFKDDDDDRG